MVRTKYLSSNRSVAPFDNEETNLIDDNTLKWIMIHVF